MVTVYTVVGLAFDIVGAWLVAYEILWGYPKRNRAMYESEKLSSLEEFVTKMLHDIDTLDDPPYTRQEKNQMKTDFSETWNPKISDLRSNLDTLVGETFRTKSFYLALLGIVLLSIGFMLQIIGALQAQVV